MILKTIKFEYFETTNQVFTKFFSPIPTFNFQNI